MSKATELFEKVTNHVINLIENTDAGEGRWQTPWQIIADLGTAINIDGKPYRGLNAMVLPLTAAAKGYDENIWGTYKAWQAKGAQVQRGEKSTEVVFWSRITKESKDEAGEDKTDSFLIAKTYRVFNIDQVEGAEAILAKHQAKREALTPVERIATAEAYFNAVGSNVTEAGNRAFFRPSTDSITIPNIDQFESAEAFYHTLAHEHIHWTGHESRLNRDLKNRFGSDDYAMEELVAELGAAMLSAQLGLGVFERDDHAKYLASWLKVLRQDAKALVTVASRSQAAVDYLNEVVAFAQLKEDHKVA